MRRTYFFIVVLFGMATATFAQTTSSDSQTLQALLAEIRQLRQDLQVSLTRIQSAQILLSRLQIQQVAASRASQHLDVARSKLAEVQVVIRSEAAEIKHYEDSGDHAAQVEDALDRAKADLQASTILRSNASRQKRMQNSKCERSRTNSACSNHNWTNWWEK